MPRVNIYIRKEDFPTWEAIKDKPRFVHEAIAATETSGQLPYVTLKRFNTSGTSPSSRPPIDKFTKTLQSNKSDIKFCKHEAVKGFCKQGCK